MLTAKADSMLHGRARFTVLYPVRTIFNPAQVSNGRKGSIPEPLKSAVMDDRFLILAIRTIAQTKEH
jgi:hypothetical protein